MLGVLLKIMLQADLGLTMTKALPHLQSSINLKLARGRGSVFERINGLVISLLNRDLLIFLPFPSRKMSLLLSAKMKKKKKVLGPWPPQRLIIK